MQPRYVRRRSPEERRRHAAYEAYRRRQIAYGCWEPWADAEPVRAHVRHLMTQGLSRRRVAELADVPDAAVMRLLYGGTGRPPVRQIRGHRARALLAVRATRDVLSPHARVDATGTHRRLQALVAMGWSQVKLSEQLGVHRDVVSQYLSRAKVYAQSAAAVRDLYDRLWNVPPPEATRWDRSAAEYARRKAAAAGWVPPLAWDDETIDDPAARPHGATKAAHVVDPIAVEQVLAGHGGGLNRAERREAVRIGTARGLSAEELAALLDISDRTVQRDRSEART
jgi:transcriptional regulator with XRE-family HTH domain